MPDFIIENTRFVRNDPANLMSDTLTWYLYYGPTGVITIAEQEEVMSNEFRVVSGWGRNVSISEVISNQFTVNGNSRNNNTSIIRIYDVQGKILQTFNADGTVTKYWKAPSAGVFFIQLKSGTTSQAKKIVVR